MEQIEWSTARFPPKLRFLFEPARYKVLFGGRGGAKSWGAGRALLIKGSQEKLTILCTREYQNSIEESVYKLLVEQIKALKLEEFYEIQSNTIHGSNGTQFIFKGLKVNINSVKSFEGVDIAWVEEAQTVSRNSWEVLIPTIRKENSEIWITFNPSLEEDETYQRFVKNPPSTAVVKRINWQDNPFFPDVLRQEMEDLKVKDYDAYSNIWQGQCRVALNGAVYAKELRAATEESRITRVPYDPTVGVQTVWDLGFSDATAIFCVQRVGFEYHFIEYLEFRQTTVTEILRILQTKGYLYDTDFLPHDAQAKTLSSGGVSVEQLLKNAGRKVKIVPKLSVWDGINAARTLFPKFYFDQEKCSEGLQRLRHYKFDIDDGGNFSRTPVHDDNSHAADSLRYAAVSIKGSSSGSKLNLKPANQAAIHYLGDKRPGGIGSTGWMGQ